VRPRVVALCVFRDHGRILVFESYDRVTNETFFRPLGGGVEFGEYAADAVVREIREELGAEITGVVLLGVLENMFEYEGDPHHEVLFVFDARLADAALYSRPELSAVEANGTPLQAVWKTLGEFVAPGHPPLYPSGLTELLTRSAEPPADPPGWRSSRWPEDCEQAASTMAKECETPP